MVNIFGIIVIVVLYYINSEKTTMGVKKGVNKIFKNLHLFLNLIIIVSVSLYFVSDQILLKYLGNENLLISLSIAIGVGSIAFLPGFIVFPLSGILIDKGVDYIVIAAFTTTLMMVGIITFQIEKNYFGAKLTIIRNIFGLITALIVTLFVGLFYGGI